MTGRDVQTLLPSHNLSSHSSAEISAPHLRPTRDSLCPDAYVLAADDRLGSSPSPWYWSDAG